MTIEHIMLLASVAQTPRDWAEVRAAIVALLDAEAEACHAIVSEEDLRWDAMDRIRARIAARKGGRMDDRPSEHPCKLPSGELEHDFEIVSTWQGDPGVINGTQTVCYLRCFACGEERPATDADMPGDYDD